MQKTIHDEKPRKVHHHWSGRDRGFDPVLARVKCENSSGSFENIFPVEAVHGYARNQREEGFIVTVEWLYEVPQEAQNWWAEYFIAVGGK